MELGLKDKNGAPIKIGDKVFFENVFDSGEYGYPEDDNCIGEIVFYEGHTYFRYPFQNKKGFEDKLFGIGFDWDSEECVVQSPDLNSRSSNEDSLNKCYEVQK